MIGIVTISSSTGRASCYHLVLGGSRGIYCIVFGSRLALPIVNDLQEEEEEEEARRYRRRNNKVKIKIIGITQDDEDGESVKDG